MAALTRRTGARLATLAATLIVAACDGSSDGDARPAASANPDATTASTDFRGPDGSIDPCEVVTPEEVSTLFGRPVIRTEASNVGYRTCTFYFTEADPDVMESVSDFVDVGICDSVRSRAMFDQVYQGAPLADLGEVARVEISGFGMGNGIVAWTGSVCIAVDDVSTDSTEISAAERQLAQLIIDRL